MQRKPTKNTRGANADEKRFQGWCKDQECSWCGNPGPSIVDHCRGATFKHNKTLIGHWFCIPQCVECDTKKTIHGKRLGNESLMWRNIVDMLAHYSGPNWLNVPDEVYDSIMDWGR